jgi:hypothetical protein
MANVHACEAVCIMLGENSKEVLLLEYDGKSYRQFLS